MSDMVTVIVTGACGDLGQSVIKALRLSRDIDCNLIGVDADAKRRDLLSVYTDSCYLSPRAADEAEYVDRIASIADAHSPSVIVPACEPDIRVLGQPAVSGMLRDHGATVVCQPRNAIDSWGDKLLCFNMLSEAVPVPWYSDGTVLQVDERACHSIKYPVVVKSRHGHGKNSVFVARDYDEIRQRLWQCREAVVQEYLNVEYGEYSIGVFRYKGSLRLIGFKRWIGGMGGSTVRACLDMDSRVLEYARSVADACWMDGSFNIQIALNNEGSPRVLEINPRFSALAACRALCGFNDVAWSVMVARGRNLAEWSLTCEHLEVERFISERVCMTPGGKYVKVAEWW